MPPLRYPCLVFSSSSPHPHPRRRTPPPPALLAHVTSDQETGPVLRLCYDLGVEDVARLSGGEVNGRHSSLVFLNGSIVGATGWVVA